LKPLDDTIMYDRLIAKMDGPFGKAFVQLLVLKYFSCDFLVPFASPVVFKWTHLFRFPLTARLFAVLPFVLAWLLAGVAALCREKAALACAHKPQRDE